MTEDFGHTKGARPGLKTPLVAISPQDGFLGSLAAHTRTPQGTSHIYIATSKLLESGTRLWWCRA